MMSRRRKNRPENPQTTPEVAPAPVPAPVSADELAALRARLAAVESQAAPLDLSPFAARQREKAAQDAMFFRADSDTACPLCGQVGGAQRQFTGAMLIRTPAWVCDPCAQAVAPGIGTSIVRTFTDSVTRDRLACLAAGMERPTPTFRALAARYGLIFQLAPDAPEGAGNGTAWSHLGDLREWQEVGAKALRRDDAGLGVFPATPVSALCPEMVDGFEYDPTHPLGRRFAQVPKQVDPPSAEQLADRLRAEEEAVEAELEAQAVRAAEAVKEDALRAERARIDSLYRKAVREFDRGVARHRKGLREDRRRMRATAGVRSDFNAIVGGM